MTRIRPSIAPMVRYAWTGIACGASFSILAWLLDGWWHHATDAVATPWTEYVHNPLHWMIAGAPLVLGVAGYQYGKARHLHMIAHQHHQFIEAVLQTVDCLIMVIDRQGRILHFNRACEQATEYTAGEVLNKSFANLFLLPDQQAGVVAVIERLVAGEVMVQYQNVWRTKTGEQRMIAWSNTALRDAAGTIAYLIGTGVDITEQQQLERDRHMLMQQLHDQANLDPLTGIANRRAFWESATVVLQREHGEYHTITVLLFDLDHFKTVNDTYGHPAGDEVLQQVAERCRAHLRPTDLLARYGGEEFVIALPHTGLAEACHIAERLRCAVADAPVSTASGAVRVTISGGLAQSLPGTDTIDALVEHADQALYVAKQRGRNCVVAWNELFTFHAATPVLHADGLTHRRAAHEVSVSR